MRIERDITMGFFWIILEYIFTINKKRVITIPDLKVKYTGEVVRYLEERERIPKSLSLEPQALRLADTEIPSTGGSGTRSGSRTSHV